MDRVARASGGRAEAEAACFACFFLPLTAAPPGRLFVYMAS